MVYLYLSAPALWCYSAVECIKRYLLSQVPCSDPYSFMPTSSMKREALHFQVRALPQLLIKLYM